MQGLIDLFGTPLGQRVLGSFARQGLTALAAALVMRGYMTEQTGTTIAAELSPLIISGIWTFIKARHSEREVQVAIVAPPGTPREVIAERAKQ